MTQAFPLTWPEGWPRTQRPAGSQFRTTLNGALTNVQDSLRKFAADSGKKLEAVVISSNVTLGQMKPADAGVAVYFTWDGLATCIAVDRYVKVEENLQAIHHCIEAERTKLRHGGINLVRAAFRGYAALPPPSGSRKRPWRVVFDLTAGETVTADLIMARFRRLATMRHPDADGGSTEAFQELVAARDEALALCGDGSS